MICAGITKAGDNVTVEYVAGDAGHGNGWGDPYRYLDIFDTAISNGWLPVPSVQIGTDFRHYFFPWRITIQGADTYFLWQEEGVMIETAETYAFYVEGANFRANISAYKKPHNIITTSNQKSILFDNSVSGLSEIEDTGFSGLLYFRAAGDVTLTRCYSIGCSYPYLSNNVGVSLDDLIISRGVYGLTPVNNFVSANRIKIQNCDYGIFAGRGSFDMSNLRIVNCIFDILLRPNAAGVVVNLTDSQIDVSSMTKNTYAGNNDVTLNLKSTFKINITNGDGGTATLYDQFGNVVATQTLSGEWEVAGKVLYYKRYYEVTDGVESADEITEYFPFSLVVTKAGKQTLTVPGINIEAGEITHVRAGMIDVLEYTEALIEGTIDEENFDFEFKEEEFTFELD